MIVLAEVLPIHTVRRWLSVTLPAACSSTLSGSVTMVNVALAVMSVETAVAVSVNRCSEVVTDAYGQLVAGVAAENYVTNLDGVVAAYVFNNVVEVDAHLFRRETGHWIAVDAHLGVERAGRKLVDGGEIPEHCGIVETGGECCGQVGSR